jgi:hypothetical protein
MIREMHDTARVVAVVGTEPSDVPFPFTYYAAIASARDHLGPIVVQAEHLPYGVWWDRLRPTIELTRDGELTGSPLPLDGVWCRDGRFISSDDAAYAESVSCYRTGDGLF